MKNIRTVLGDISQQELGLTYSHEHLWTNPPLWQPDRDLELSDYFASIGELNIFKKVGGKTLVEASTLDYGRDAKKLVGMSKDTGVNIVATTGFNKYMYYPSWAKVSSLDDFTNRFVIDITQGMDGTTACAGFLKSGSSYYRIFKQEELVTRAVSVAHKKTNAPIWIHTEAGTMGHEMLDIFETEGVDLSAVAVGHTDRNCNPDYIFSLLDRGAYVQFDGVSKIKYYPDNIRVDLIKEIVKNNFAEQLLISGDMGRKCYLIHYGGGPGFGFIINNFIPQLQRAGISEETIHTIFFTNPARWLGRF